jgi:ornithine cyclodeaminase/alanine dehydrogenase-like protein (mu-crystallin family)
MSTAGDRMSAAARPAVPVLGADAVRTRLPMRAAIAALEAAFASARPTGAPQRLHLAGVAGGEHADEELLVMPILVDGWSGTKLVSLVAGNPARGLPRVSGTYTLFGPPGLQPLAHLDGTALTELRTAAVSGLATSLLARRGARRVVIVGAGVQARAHVRAMVAVLEDRGEHPEVVIVARDAAAFDDLVDDVRSHGVEVPLGRGPMEAISAADVVCLCTSSPTPVVTAGMLPGGVHVNAVGAYRPDMRELDGTSVASCSVSVELRDAAMAEKGDLLQAEAEGLWHREAIRADLHELAAGMVLGRQADEERTLFASVGHASEDLIVARAVLSAQPSTKA